jgi:hypothetical protein
VRTQDASVYIDYRVTTVMKRALLRCHLYIKCIILPKQARDKHRENSKKDIAFLQANADDGSISEDPQDV